MIIAEAATVHPDGTISLLRAGLDRFAGPKLPILFQGTLVVRVQGVVGDDGMHIVDLRCMNQDGKLVAPAVKGNLAVPPGGGNANLLFGMQLAFPEAGRLLWVLRIDHHIVDELNFTVVVEPPKPVGGAQDA